MEVSDLLDSLVAEPMIVLPTIGATDLFPEGDCQKNDTQFAKLLTTTWEPFLRPWMQDPNNQATFSQYGCYNATVEGFGVLLLNTEFWSMNNGASGSSTFCDEGHVGHQVFMWAESVIAGYRDAGMKVVINFVFLFKRPEKLCMCGWMCACACRPGPSTFIFSLHVSPFLFVAFP